MSEQTNHALFQLTGALRNIVSEEKIYESFISCGASKQLCQAIELFISDLDIVSNISRIFRWEDEIRAICTVTHFQRLSRMNPPVERFKIFCDIPLKFEINSTFSESSRSIQNSELLQKNRDFLRQCVRPKLLSVIMDFFKMKESR